MRVLHSGSHPQHGGALERESQAQRGAGASVGESEFVPVLCVSEYSERGAAGSGIEPEDGQRGGEVNMMSNEYLAESLSDIDYDEPVDRVEFDFAIDWGFSR